MNFPHEGLLRPMINMISGIKPNYGVYLIHIALGQEGLDMIHLLTYRRSCPRGRTTVHQDGTEDGIIHILSARISHHKHEMILGNNPQSRFERNPHEQQSSVRLGIPNIPL